MAWGVPKLGTLVEDPVSGGSFTLIEPAGVAQGDLMIACIAYRGNAAITAPVGWSTVATAQNSGDTDATNGIASGVMFYITRGASAPDLVCTRTAGDVVQARVVSYSGYSGVHDTGTANTLAVASATATTGTFSTAEANELIVAMVSGGDNYTVSTGFDAATDPTTASGTTADTTTAPTAGTWILRHVSGTGTGADSTLAFADAIRATAGATGQISVVLSGSARQVMIAGAFKMAAEGAILTAATGTLAETGVAPNLLRGRNLIAETQTYALTGVAAGLAKGKILTAELGTFVIGSSTLATDLKAFWKLEEASGTRVDEVGNNDLTDNNTVTQAVGKVGNAAQFTAANTEWLSLTLSGSDLVLSNQDFTLSCWVYFDSTHNPNIIDQRAGFSLYSISGVPRLYVEGTGSGEAVWGSTLSNATWYHIIAWHEQGVGVSISVNNGTPVFTSYTGGITNTATTFVLGRYNPGAIAYLDGRLDAVGFWKRLLAAGERTELYNSGTGKEYPFAVATPATLIHGHRLIADVGSFAVTGIAPTLTATSPKKLTADVGTFAVAGVAPTLQLAHKVAADLGTFALSGVDVAFPYSQVLAANLGTFTETGVNPNLLFGHKIQSEVGSFALSGVAPTLSLAHKLTAATGSFAITGLDVTFISTKVVTPDIGIFTLTGVAASQRIDKRLSSGVGSYAVTGVSPNLVAGGSPTMAVDPGTLTLTGVAPTLAIGRRLSCAVGSFTATGIDPNLLSSRRVVAAIGTLTLAGIDPTLAYRSTTFVLATDLGVFTLTGVNAALARFVDGNTNQFTHDESNQWTAGTGAVSWLGTEGRQWR